MTAQIGSAVTAKVVQRINAPTGVNANLAALTQGNLGLLSPLNPGQIRSGNSAADLTERSNVIQYPTANVYCEKIDNSLIEKFRTFSGNLQMVVELRHSQDRLDGIQAGLELYADSVLQVLDTNRGDWGDGMYYAGGYLVTFGPAKHGGKNFIQAAKIAFEIGVSIS